MRTEEVNIAEANLRGVPVVRFSGSIHLKNSPGIRKALKKLTAQKSPALIVSLDATRYVDTSGLATLVECAQNMRNYGGQLAVVGLSAQVADAFSVAQLEGIFSVFKTEAEAAEHLGPKQ